MQRFRSYVPAGVILGLFVLALVGLNVTRDVSASGESPTPTPAYAPPYSSTIDVFYTMDGIPTVGFGPPIQFSFVNGQRCNVAGPAIVNWSLSEQVAWPWYSGHSPCSQIGAVVSLCLSPPGACTEDFTFTGEETSVRMELFSDVDAPTIETNFVSDNGAPVTVEITGVSFRMGSFVCRTPQVPVPVRAEAFVVLRGLLSEPCQRPNAGLRALFSTVNHGDVSASFVWEGDDVTTFDVVVPDIATATPSPSPPPTASPMPTPSTATTTASPTASPTPTPALTPVQLPTAGGPPAPGSGFGER